MEQEYKIASGFGPFSPCGERFVVNGYREPMNLQGQFEAASKINGLTAIGLDYPYQFRDPKEISPLLEKYALRLCTVEIGLYPDRKWKMGTYTSPDPGIRREAIKMSKDALDVAAKIGADDVLLWPGQDGFDYPFQVDYSKNWGLLIDGIAEVAAHRPDVKIAIEYKPKEPRTNIYVRNAGVLLYLLTEIDMANVGAALDYGHSLVAGESPAEAVALLARAGKIFQVHVNDNFRDWDHDLIVGGVTFWETLEFFYWLRRLDYKGYYILDIFPYREEGQAALQEGVDRVKYFIDAANRLDENSLARYLDRHDSIMANKSVWKKILGLKRGGSDND
ncbi:MAG: Xylose isomerase [Firmicutes bacterium]|nr:Xylose isomerase [Bacillota bacterium]